MADIVRRGRDVTLAAWSKMVSLSLEAAELLADEGIDVEVIDLRTLVPLDERAVLESVERTGRLVVAQEAPRRAGYGAEIVALIAEHLPGTPATRVAGLDTPIPMAPALERVVLPSANRIAGGVRSVLGRPPAAGATTLDEGGP